MTARKSKPRPAPALAVVPSPAARRTVCLCMMVKDEGPVIERAIRSALPHIDAWVVSDTGSTDNTCALAVQAFDDLPGRLHHHDWVDFATGRTAAFRAAAEQGCDYILVMDADQTLVVTQEDYRDHLRGDAFNINIEHGDMTYPHPWLLSSALAWYWKGSTHEYVHCDGPFHVAPFTGLHLVEHADSHRRATGAKSIEDLAILQAAHEADPADARTVFYLAQAYADLGRLPCALKLYRERVRMGGWKEEVWCAQYRAAKVLERQQAWEHAVDAYLVAYALEPGRAEPLYRLGRGYLSRGHFSPAGVFFGQATDIAEPTGSLFVERHIYDYQAAWGLSMVYRLLAMHQQAQEWEDKVLAGPRTPAHVVAEVLNSRLNRSIGSLP